jgi:hypothetical protein
MSENIVKGTEGLFNLENIKVVYCHGEKPIGTITIFDKEAKQFIENNLKSGYDNIFMRHLSLENDLSFRFGFKGYSTLVWTNEMCKAEYKRIIELKKRLTKQLEGITQALWHFEGVPPDGWYCPEWCGNCEGEYQGIGCCDLPTDMWNDYIKQWRKEIENE